MSAAPQYHKLLFQYGGRLLEFFQISKQVYGLWKPSFFQFKHVLGLRLSAFVPLVLLPAFRLNFLVRFVTSAASLVFVATKASLLVFSAAIGAVSCSSTTFSVVAAAARLLK